MFDMLGVIFYEQRSIVTEFGFIEVPFKLNAMSQNLTQPEEIDHALMEMAWKDIKEDTPIAGKKNLSGNVQKDWRGGYVSPYRAAHMKPKQGLLDP